MQVRDRVWSVMAAPGQVPTPSPGPVSGTGHLGQATSSLVIYSIHGVPQSLSLNPETLTGWKVYEAEEQHQESHALLEALGFSVRP